jgi:hypothetical protein
MNLTPSLSLYMHIVFFAGRAFVSAAGAKGRSAHISGIFTHLSTMRVKMDLQNEGGPHAGDTALLQKVHA